MTRICTKCKQELPLDCFNNIKGGKYGKKAHCKNCENTYAKEKYKRNKEFVDKYKTQCAKCGCGESYVLMFHHINHKIKSFNITPSHKGLKSLENEIKKCVCLCHNCHQTYHYFYGIQPTNPEESLNDFLRVDWQPPEV